MTPSDIRCLEGGMAVTATDTPTAGATTRTPFRVPTHLPVIITIDGPAGTGKSTVARLLAHRLGLDFLDTGAMYRCAAAIMIDRGIEPEDVGELVSTVIGADLHFDWQADPPMILAWDAPMDHRIRQPDVTAAVSKVAAIGELRNHMVRKQRVIAAQHPRLVTEGRDQGSVVFPDAEVKFYLDADPGIRAQRRAEQLRESGVEIELETLKRQILERDRLDSTRADGPLICPHNALRVDTSSIDLDGVVDLLEKHVRQRIGALVGGSGG
jgi:cytidylate kinase